MTPTTKSSTIDQLLTSMFGVDRRGAIQSNRCTMCGKEAEQFRNELSAREYRISGMCQQCQDEVFGGI